MNEPKRVFVVGHHGMLGHVVARYLAEQGHEILTTEARYVGGGNSPLIRAVIDSNADWIINCAGKTVFNVDDNRELYMVNTQLPMHLRLVLRDAQRMIHASTDGVFSGNRGSYLANDSHDSEDDYGLSKSLAEVIAEDGKCTVIRCSIIGPDHKDGIGLMAWLFRQVDFVEGFTNHYWNGITTLAWSKICGDLIAGDCSLDRAILQPGTVELSKFELLKLIGDAYDLNVEVVPKLGSDLINRTLVPNLPRSSMAQQLKELRDWY